MNPTQADVDQAVAAARALQTEGRFTKVKQGDERAASYFARMVASRANPNGSRKGWGWLKKTGGGFNIEGYADGAIVFGDDPDDRKNVLKIVTQVGSSDPNAIQIGTAVQDRRDVDVWANPIPLPESIPAYLEGGHPVPQPQPVPQFPNYEALGGDAGGQKFSRILEADYKRAEKPGVDGDFGTWPWRTCYDFIVGICKTVEESIAKHQPEWRAELNKERVSQGKSPINW